MTAPAPLTIADIRLAVRQELATAERPLLLTKAAAAELVGKSVAVFDELVALGPKHGGIKPGRRVPGQKLPMWYRPDLEKWAAGLPAAKDRRTPPDPTESVR